MSWRGGFILPGSSSRTGRKISSEPHDGVPLLQLNVPGLDIFQSSHDNHVRRTCKCFSLTKTPVDVVSRAYNHRNDAMHICMHML